MSRLPLPKFLPKITSTPKSDLRQRLLRMEAQVGGQLFGEISKGHRREFFALDEHTWVWHEEWKDAKGNRQVVNTRYDVRPSGVLKSQNGQAYQRLSREEARNLYRTVELYRQRVGQEYQRLIPTA